MASLAPRLRCPLDGGDVAPSDQGFQCAQCETTFPLVEIAQRAIPDFRCIDIPRAVSITFTIPQSLPDFSTIQRFGAATDAKFPCLSREEIRRQFGTKLQKEILFYLEALLHEVGTTASILDLGCGSGGNRRYLEHLGFTDVVSGDYMSDGATILLDVHRLPFESNSFDLVLTTATLEHFYNPFIAFSEISRVLKGDGRLIASGSFWESWHGNSCFHYSPGGLMLLCRSAGLELVDLWSGWGFIPSVSTHALGLGGLKALTYRLQDLFDFGLTCILGRNGCKRHRFRTSGSFGLLARKPAGTSAHPPLS